MMEYRVQDCCARLDSMQVTEKIKSFHSVNLQGNLVLYLLLLGLIMKNPSWILSLGWQLEVKYSKISTICEDLCHD